MTATGREQLVSACLPHAGRFAVDAGMRQVERLTAEMLPLRHQIVAIGTRQPGCRAPQLQHGIGPLLAVAMGSGDDTQSSCVPGCGKTSERRLQVL